MTELPAPPTYIEGLKLLQQLAMELNELSQLDKHIERPISIRLKVRSLFSIVDAYSFFLKTRVLSLYECETVALKQKNLDFLREFKESKTGAETVRIPYHSGIKENLKLSLSLYSKALGVVTPLGGAHRLPQSFDHALRLRARITHPKRLSDLEISISDSASLSDLTKWLSSIQGWTITKEKELIGQVKKSASKEISDAISRIKNNEN